MGERVLTRSLRLLKQTWQIMPCVGDHSQAFTLRTPAGQRFQRSFYA